MGDTRMTFRIWCQAGSILPFGNIEIANFRQLIFLYGYFCYNAAGLHVPSHHFIPVQIRKDIFF